MGIEYSSVSGEVGGGERGISEPAFKDKELSDSASAACRSNVSSKQLYENLASMGFHFGPTSQKDLKDIRHEAGGKAQAVIALKDWAKKTSKVVADI